ncbi:MAG: hypothetical protein IJ458_02800, partial [Clostridia bacterium]|nr:hypothetical protein [Clostridia bacterium]
MKLAKKLILSLSIAFTMCVALVIGCVLNSSPNPSNALGDINSNTETEILVDNVEVVKPLTYTHQPGEVVVKKGGNTLNYNYTPSVNAKSSTGTIAYEYCFANPMTSSTAVNLKEIDTTDVNVSYAWSLNTKI